MVVSHEVFPATSNGKSIRRRSCLCANNASSGPSDAELVYTFLGNTVKIAVTSVVKGMNLPARSLESVSSLN